MKQKMTNGKSELENMTWYVVELSFRQSNPIHRAICFHRSSGHLELTASYEGVIAINFNKLAHFEVITKIEEMNNPKSQNMWKLPRDLKGETDESTR